MAYATIDALRAVQPKSEWVTAKKSAAKKVKTQEKA